MAIKHINKVSDKRRRKKKYDTFNTLLGDHQNEEEKKKKTAVKTSSWQRLISSNYLSKIKKKPYAKIYMHNILIIYAISAILLESLT